MKILNIEDLEKLEPRINLDLIKSLSIEEKVEYIKLYCLYANLLIKYINSKFNISSYEERIENSGLNFVPIEESNMDSYQFISSDTLKYFYLRNTLHIDRLGKSDYMFLKNKLKKNDPLLDKETEAFIARTFEKVSLENEAESNRAFCVRYGPDSNNYFGTRNSIILGFRYDEFNQQGLDDNEWNQQYDQQIIFLTQMLADIENNINSQNDIQVQVIKYNDFSVRTRKKKINREEEEK